ncbi:MAG TPA: LCP family protein [Acidimicrobiia bacterium]
MTKKQLMSAVAGSVVVATVVGCASAAPTTTTSTTSTSTTTTTTTIPTTTTTLPPFEIEGAPGELAALIEQFYAFTTGESTEAPPLPEPVASIEPLPRETPLHGVASVGTFREQQVATVEIGDDLFLAVNEGSAWRIVGGSWPALELRYFGEFPRLVAVIGSDARPGQDQDRSRGDSIHVVGLDGRGAGGIVGIPRDAYVPIPGVGRNKINAALSRGGPDVMFETMKQVSGLPLEGYVLTGFEGFRMMVGAVLGGIEVDIPFDINDKHAKAYFEAGKQLLNGKNALAFARPRKTVPGGDFTRSQFQGMLLLGAVQAVAAQGYGAIPALMEGSDPWLSTNMTPEQILTFSAAAISADAAEIPNVVVPGRGGWAGNASVVHLSSGGEVIWEDLADGALEN